MASDLGLEDNVKMLLAVTMTGFEAVDERLKVIEQSAECEIRKRLEKNVEKLQNIFRGVINSLQPGYNAKITVKGNTDIPSDGSQDFVIEVEVEPPYTKHYLTNNAPDDCPRNAIGLDCPLHEFGQNLTQEACDHLWSTKTEDYGEHGVCFTRVCVHCGLVGDPENCKHDYSASEEILVACCRKCGKRN